MIRFLPTLISFLSFQIVFSQAPIVNVGNLKKAENEPQICLSEHERIAIQNRLKTNIQILSLDKARLANNHPLFGFPLKKSANLPDNDFYSISNFVDRNPAVGNQGFNQYGSTNQDYNCGNRTYDQNNGYNHAGIDYMLYPFAWHKMDNNQVEVVAAADGIIIGKDDGNPDRSCGWDTNPYWNAVYVRHSDGSTAWYGHLKKNSLTAKGIGQTVTKGEFLGYVGSSGFSTAPHLHFEVHDVNNNVIDPYSGACNTNDTWWENQKPYYDKTINSITTHAKLPNIDVCPPEQNLMNIQDDFLRGQTIYIALWGRDLQEGYNFSSIISRPNGSIYATYNFTWNQSGIYPAFYFYYYYTLPTNAEIGEWKFQVTFGSQSYTKIFNVISPCTLTAPIISASPSTDILANTNVTLSASGCAGSLSWSNNATTSTITVSPSASIVYYATCTLNDCTNTGSIALNVRPCNTPTYNIAAGKNPIEANDSTILSVNVPYASNVLWQLNGTNIPDASGNYIYAKTGGTYTAEITPPKWQQHMPSFNNMDLNEVFFINEKEGWALGLEGTIVHTIDGGVNWENQTSNSSFELKDIFFSNNQKGWAVGTRGTVLKTSDGGKKWLSVNIGISSDIHAVFFKDISNGWMMTQTDGIFRTQNGGQTWTQTSEIEGNIYFVDGYFSSASQWILLAYDKILYTNNAGASWQTFTYSGAQFIKLSFIDNNNGWAMYNLAGTMTFLKTTNGGATWTALSGKISTRTSDFQFTSQNNGYAIASERIFRTTDGGTTWNYQIIGDVDGLGFGSSITGLHFINASKGWLVGWYGLVYHTTDGGSSWYPQNDFFTNGFGKASFVNSTTGWVIANNKLIKTTDGGMSWTKQYPNSTYITLNGIFFLNSNIGWVVGTNGKINKTVDGGNNWTAQVSGLENTYAELKDCYFLDANSGWVVGSKVLRTKNGGVTWTQMSSFDDLEYYDVHFINSEYGWILESSGKIYRTVDGGENWLLYNTGLSSIYNETHRAFDFKDLNNGWVLTDNRIAKTSNGGISWTPINDIGGVTGNIYKDIKFFDTNNGWLVSSKGLFSTNNGGANWQKVSNVTPHRLQYISLLGGGSGWLSGLNTLLKYNNNNCTVLSNPLVLISPCSPQLSLVSPTDNISSGNVLKQTSKLNGSIQASNQITGTAKVTLQAKTILLNPNFRADKGTVFKAEIGGCN